MSALNINSNKFAISLGISRTTIDGYTVGRKKTNGEIVLSQPNFEVIKKMVEVYNVNANYILGLSDEIFNNDDFVIKYIIKNNERISKNPVFKEYLKLQDVQIRIEKEEEALKLEKKAIKEDLLNRLKKAED